MNQEIYTDHAIINWVLDHCKVLHLGLIDGKQAYVVPVNYGYEEDSAGHFHLYIHGTKDGKKGKLLQQSPSVNFETDGGHEGLTYTPPAAGAFAPAYRSVMGKGQVKAIADSQAKVHALRVMIHHYVRDIPAIIRPEEVQNVPVWEIDVDQITAKLHHPTKEWQDLLGIKAPLLKGYHYSKSGKLTAVDQQTDTDADTGASQGGET